MAIGRTLRVSTHTYIPPGGMLVVALQALIPIAPNPPYTFEKRAAQIEQPFMAFILAPLGGDSSLILANVDKEQLRCAAPERDANGPCRRQRPAPLHCKKRNLVQGQRNPGRQHPIFNTGFSLRFCVRGNGARLTQRYAGCSTKK